MFRGARYYVKIWLTVTNPIQKRPFPFSIRW